ncbi:MAG: DUF1512 family protein [Candidatus Nanohaloarchaea archaeon]
MVLPGLFPTGGENNIFMIIQTVISLLFFGLIFFFPRIMVWQTDRKLRYALTDLEAHKNDAETMFLSKLSDSFGPGFEKKFRTMKDFKFSAPTGIDPAGLVKKLEHVLDNSENKFERFIRQNADTEDEEELADLNMAFKGVMGTHQIYKVLRHFRQLIVKTKNFQLIGLIQMMLPIYKELAESQKEATRAFIDQAPIGDAIGPLVAAKLIEEEPEEISEDIVHAEREFDDKTVHVLKSDGPGARLGKYGDAIDTLASENDLDAIITVDAGAKFEGEETGSISEGVGVMMGGPGVEKSKIEEAATEHGVPLEGVIIKQSPPEASKPMKREIYDAYEEAVEKAKELAMEHDGDVAVVGVGNTCGVANTREEVAGVHNRLRKYWEEYEEQEEEDVSYMGLMGAMPGGDQSSLEDAANSLLWRLPRF